MGETPEERARERAPRLEQARGREPDARKRAGGAGEGTGESPDDRERTRVLCKSFDRFRAADEAYEGVFWTHGLFGIDWVILTGRRLVCGKLGRGFTTIPLTQITAVDFEGQFGGKWVGKTVAVVWVGTAHYELDFESGLMAEMFMRKLGGVLR